jgi:hypothetical protein
VICCEFCHCFVTVCCGLCYVLVRPVLAAAEKWHEDYHPANCMFMFNEDDPAHAGSDADTKLILALQGQLSVMTEQIDKVLVLKATGTEVFRKLALELEPMVKDYKDLQLLFSYFCMLVSCFLLHFCCLLLLFTFIGFVVIPVFVHLLCLCFLLLFQILFTIVHYCFRCL